MFDRSGALVVQDIAQAVLNNQSPNGRPSMIAGILAIGTGSAEPAVAVAIATGAKRVTLASPSVSLGSIPRRPGLSRAVLSVGVGMVTGNVALQVHARAHGIRVKYVWGSSLMNNEVGPMLWERFLPTAEVVGSGLEQVQVALDRLRVGVSATKLVVEL